MDELPSCDLCPAVGAHLCVPRARRVERVFEEALVHTKDEWAGGAFLLRPWQRDGIVRPLFGEVVWSDERQRWRRRYDMAHLELGRGNGKSEMLAGIALVLLIADGVRGAEVYGLAGDIDQARVVWDVAEQMVALSPPLARRLTINKQTRKIVDARTGSYYQVLAADAGTALGRSPSGIVLDELLVQRDSDLWSSMRTGMAKRSQPLMITATTAGRTGQSFAQAEHEYCAKVAVDPARDPHRFVFMRNTPLELDPWDEQTWYHANPALGDFLSLEGLRREALEARHDPAKEAVFRQFHLNQWVGAVTRWIPMHLWDACAGPAGRASSPEELDARVLRQRCWGGLDLSTTTDMTALCWLFPALGNAAVWRFWLPEDQVEVLDRMTGGAVSPWVDAGWLRTTPGGVVDYDALYDQIDEDRRRFTVVDLSFDPWQAGPVIHELAKRGLDRAVKRTQGYNLDPALKEMLRMVKAREFAHGGNPVARWCAECVEVKRRGDERIMPVKPDRDRDAKRIDGITALANAIDGVMRRATDTRSRQLMAW